MDAKAWLILFPVLLIFVLAYSPHVDYLFPLHVDEWQHLARARHVVETGRIQQVNPYFLEPTPHPNVEPGFTLFLAFILWLFRGSLLWIFPVLPAVFAAASALSIFLLMREVSQNRWVALASMVLLASLKSNTNLLGLWFLTPLTFALPFFFLSLYLGLRYLSNPSKLHLLGLFALLGLLLVSHPLSGLLAVCLLL